MDHDIYGLEPTNVGFNFLTKQGSYYESYFIQFEGNLFTDSIDRNIFIFGFNIVQQTALFSERRKFDSRISNTLCYIVSDFLTKNQSSILLFVGDLKDGKGRQRKITFSKWYHQHLKEDILKIDRSLEEVYMSCMYHSDNPYRSIIEKDVYKMSAIGKE